jgi:hypothetical protein
MSTLPSNVLEMRAAEQRRGLHRSVEELRGRLQEEMDIKHQARKHLLPAAGVLAVVGLTIGYTLAGIFYDSRS